MGIRAERSAETETAVMVAAAYHARLVGSTYAPCAVVFPERIRADMAAGGAFVPLEIAVGKKLPSIVVIALTLIAEGGFQPVLIQEADTQGHPSVTVAGKCWG